MPKITLKRVTNTDGTTADLYPTTTLDQIISEGTGAGNTDESLSDYIDGRFILASTKGSANGVAELDSDSKVPYAQLPDAVFGGLKFVGTITDNGDYGNLSDVIIGSPATGTITVSADLDAIADNGQDTYDTQAGLAAYEAEKDKWVGYYWVVAGTNTVTMEEADNSDGSAYWGASAFDDGVEITGVGAVLEPGDWLVISGWDETLNSNNGGFLFSVINNTYTTAGTSTKGIVQLSNASDTSALSGNDVVTEGVLNSLIGSIGDSNKLAPAAHNHDGTYYTKTEIGSFFSGGTSITGYNKTNWDTAYGWGDHASAGYQSATNSQTVTLSGSVTGTGTITDFGNVSITTTTNHNHDTRYYTETEFNNWLDGDTAIDGHNFTEILYGASPSSNNVGTILIDID